MLGTTVDRKWFIFPAVVAGFLLQHTVQGWCPPLPVLRRLGFRTQTEIEEEKHVLKALRGNSRASRRRRDAGPRVTGPWRQRGGDGKQPEREEMEHVVGVLSEPVA